MMETIPCPICKSDRYSLIYKAFDYKVSKEWFNIVRCNDCRVVYTNPRPEQINIGNYYPQTYRRHKHIKTPFNSSNQNTGQINYKVLDIGCGNGEWLLEMKKKGYQVYGTEIRKDTVSYLNKIGINAKCGSIEDVNFEKKQFDYIRLRHVFEHIYDPFSTLNEIKKILKEDGVLEIIVPNFLSIEAKYLKNNYKVLNVPRHLFHYTANSLQKILNQDGFYIESVNYQSKLINPFKSGFWARLYGTFKLLNASNNTISALIKLCYYNFIIVSRYLCGLVPEQEKENIIIQAKKS